MSIFSKNTVHSILYLVLIFCNATGLLILLNVDYLAMVYVVVYVGAIAVLFLFVVMMLNIKLLELNDTFWHYLPIGLLVFASMSAEVLFLFNSINFNIEGVYGWLFDQHYHQHYPTPNYFEHDPIVSSDSTFKGVDSSFYYTDWLDLIVGIENIQAIGSIMYSHYFISFILSSLVLLVAMMGSITLTLRHTDDTKRQNLFFQVTRDFKSAVFMGYSKNKSNN